MSKNFKTSINPLDISTELKKVEKYSNIILKEFVNMVNETKDFIKKMFFSSFKYSYIVVIIFFIILAFTILFSKNKIGNLLILCYIFIIIFILGFISGILALLITTIEMFIKLCKSCYKLFKSNLSLTIKNVIRVIVVILEIISYMIALFVVVVVLVVMALIIDFFFGINIKIFNTINGLYKKESLIEQTPFGAIDSFGDMIRKGFENC